MTIPETEAEEVEEEVLDERPSDPIRDAEAAAEEAENTDDTEASTDETSEDEVVVVDTRLSTRTIEEVSTTVVYKKIVFQNKEYTRLVPSSMILNWVNAHCDEISRYIE